MIGIDVGGANLKIIDGRQVHIHYCPLWEHSSLRQVLQIYKTRKNQDAAVVMSGELADCFQTKAEGIHMIVDAVREVFPSALFYGTDGVFHDGAVPELAAANWLASADYLMNVYPGALFVDFGSTTTDIIPLGDFQRLKGLTDLARLQNGYLVYTGLLRTAVPTLIRSVVIGGIRTRISTEFFACSADAHLVLGHITPDQYSVDTPDRKGKGREASMRRLARVVCADLEEIGEESVLGIASSFWDAQRSIIVEAVGRVRRECGTDLILTAGVGSSLMAEVLSGRDLNRDFGAAADALPAFAVREVALRSPCS